MINKVLLMEFFKDDDIKVVDKDFYIKSQMKNDVIKYITILEEENETYKTRCEKAIEYIEDNTYKAYGTDYMDLTGIKELLKILGGDE